MITLTFTPAPLRSRRKSFASDKRLLRRMAIMDGKSRWHEQDGSAGRVEWQAVYAK